MEREIMFPIGIIIAAIMTYLSFKYDWKIKEYF